MESRGKEDSFQYALHSNEAWARYKRHQNPAFFERLAKGESLNILWTGFSDSQVPETSVLGLQPGDVVLHRNWGGIILIN